MVGDRARDWSKPDLDEALKVHRGRWQEVQVREMLAYHAFDTGELEIARAHLGYACHIGKNLCVTDDPFYLMLQLEWAFVSARSGKLHPQTDALLEYARSRAGGDEYIPLLMTRVKAAQMLFEGDPKALDHIEAAERWLRSQPDAEKDCMQAELDWLQAMRDEYFESGLGAGGEKIEVGEFCPAAERVQAQWYGGQRPRDWSAEDLEEALRIHRHQWQEVRVREMIAYRALDLGEFEAAQAQLAHACLIGADIWDLDHLPFLVLHLEWIYICARSGKPHDQTEALIARAWTRVKDHEPIAYLASRAQAALSLFQGDPKALDHIEDAASRVRSRPDAEQDLVQAELYWLQDMRNEYFERGLG